MSAAGTGDAAAAAQAQAPATPVLGDLRRVVVKIGSALLVDEASGAIRHDWLAALAADIAALKARGTEVLLVSSGAVAVGRRHLGLTGRSPRLEDKQAAAATGQIQLAHAYQATLAHHDITVAQVLVTLEDTEARRRHLNARSTLRALLRHGAVPVINENDTVTTREIRFGDNDRLAARVAAMIDAEALVLLSDIDGLYTADPRRDSSARFDRRRGAGPALRHRRALHRRPAPRFRGPLHSPGDGNHRRNRGHGRRGPGRLFQRRHGDQAQRRANRAGRRLPSRHCPGARGPSPATPAGRRPLHLVRLRGGAADRAQALDRRRPEPGRCAQRGRRRAAGVAGGQVAAARRRDRSGTPARCGRYGRASRCCPPA